MTEAENSASEQTRVPKGQVGESRRKAPGTCNKMTLLAEALFAQGRPWIWMGDLAQKDGARRFEIGDDGRNVGRARHAFGGPGGRPTAIAAFEHAARR
jgi:hypothetical protein